MFTLTHGTFSDLSEVCFIFKSILSYFWLLYFQFILFLTSE